MSIVPNEMLHPNDRLVERNRLGRFLVFVTYTLLVVGLCVLFLRTFGKIVGDDIGGTIGILAGLVAAIATLSWTLEYFFVKVEAVSALVTIDNLYTLLHGKMNLSDKETVEVSINRLRRAFPTYGPGWHFAYPWEERQAKYNVSLHEVGDDLNFVIQLANGPVTYEGSFRLRPDMRNLMPFLSGVASMTSELKDLIAAFVVELQGSKGVDEALTGIKALNEALKKKFGLQTDDGSGQVSDDVSKFESRFGVYVGDVTISKVTTSKETQRTRGAIDEATTISKGTAILLGYKSPEALKRAQTAGKVTADSIKEARDRFLSISGNLEGVTINRHEVAISGLDPEVVKNIAPLATAYLAAKNAGGSKSKSKK